MIEADVADPACVRKILGYARQELPALRGVIHAAGITADASMAELDWARFSEVLDPKVRGAWHLHRQTANEDLDFFILFSSITSLTGLAGQASYVAANSFLDALAAYRRQHGLPGTSVSWGPWSGTGMAARRGLLPRLAAQGLNGIPADRALDALARVLDGTAAHSGVASVDWQRVTAARRQPYTLLADLARGGAEPARAVPVAELARLVLEDPANAHEAILADLLAQLAQLLDLADADRDALRPAFAGMRLTELALDSLTTVRLRNRLLADFAIDVPPEFLFGGGTAAEIASLIGQQLAFRNVIAADEDGLAGDEEMEVITL
jgi:hypothetical protein